MLREEEAGRVATHTLRERASPERASVRAPNRGSELDGVSTPGAYLPRGVGMGRVRWGTSTRKCVVVCHSSTYVKRSGDQLGTHVDSIGVCVEFSPVQAAGSIVMFPSRCILPAPLLAKLRNLSLRFILATQLID